MLMKKCPRCGMLMPYGPQYCETCKPLADAELEAVRERNAKRKAQMYNRHRDSRFINFYRSKAWKDLSRAYMQSARYKCQARLSSECKGIATEVHHTIPIQTDRGWDKRLDWDNLEAVCTACHNARHPEKLRRQDTEGVIDLRIFKN